MRYIIATLLLLLLYTPTVIAAEKDGVRAANQHQGRDIRVTIRRSGYSQPPNYHSSRQLPIQTGAQLSSYSHQAKPMVGTFPAIRYIERGN